MGTQAQFLVQHSTAFTSPSPSLLNPDKTYNVTISHNIIRCRSSRSRSDTDPTSSTRFRFNQDQEFYTDGDDYSKQRVWWSDYDDDDDDDDDWDVDEQDEFWIFKIFRAFGWMLPAIAVSSLLGTDVGPNAIVMALAVPLGQLILSLLVDKVWGSTTSNSPKSRSKRKTKRKPFARAATNTKTRQGKKENEAGKSNESYKAGNGRETYQSWVVADGAPSKKADKTGPRFGGWDELDNKARNYKVPNRTPRVPKNELPKKQKGKLSRTGRIRDKPLLLRLLIAVFPFLGSWTKLLF